MTILAKIEQVLKAELNPRNPVNEIMQVIGSMLQHNPGAELAILKDVGEAIGVMLARADQQQKGDKPDGE